MKMEIAPTTTTSYYSIHMKRLEMEHFLNAVSTDDFTLIKGYTK
jgi:hypothetical protein